MLPSVTGPGTAPPPPLPPGISTRADQGAQPWTGETSAAGTRALTANRVDPPRVLPAVIAPPGDTRRRPPPDPDGPAGPPPAFDATPLQRERERLFARVDLIAPPSDARATDRQRDASANAAEDTAVAPPAPDVQVIERLETDLAEVRRMADPDPGRSLDLVR